MSRTDAIPLRYPYHVGVNCPSPEAYRLQHCFKEDIDGIMAREHGLYAFPSTGGKIIGGVECYSLRCDDIDMNWYGYKSADEYNILVAKIDKLMKPVPTPVDHAVYRWDHHRGRWVEEDIYQPRTLSNYVGSTAVISQITDEINVHIKHLPKIKEMEESKGLNYLLYGPPGSGKTSTILTIATENKWPVYVTDGSGMSGSHDMLTPDKSKPGMKVLIFEDFDRYLEDGVAETVMSKLLNALDGIDDSFGVVRFFTGNNPKLILENEALLSRISQKYEFKPPGVDVLGEKFDRLFAHVSEREEEFTDKEHIGRKAVLTRAVELKWSLRNLSTFVVRHIFAIDPVSVMVNALPEVPPPSPPPTESELMASKEAEEMKSKKRKAMMTEMFMGVLKEC